MNVFKHRVKLSGIIRSLLLMVICLKHLSIVAYETGSGEMEINHCDCKDYVGDGGSITAPFIDASATDIFICVSQCVYKEFDQSFDNSYIYFSPNFYVTLDEACKVILQPTMTS
ncbi:unnamed protein product [Clavelina lepadiformis]|uniref:Uncharacterized protein n=1 Tax=Clavelina lepadiformis TaxID=159417 RepID=A0ABP0G522_CLALP